MALRIALLLVAVGVVAWILWSLLGDDSVPPGPTGQETASTEPGPAEPTEPPAAAPDAPSPSAKSPPPKTEPPAASSRSEPTPPAATAGDAEPEASISGRVFGPLDGPLDAITVIARSESDGKIWREAKTRKDGTYRIEALPAGAYTVTVRELARIHWFGDPRWFDPKASAKRAPFPAPSRAGVRVGSEGVDFRLRLPAAVMGRVVAGDTGKPLPVVGLRMNSLAGGWRSFNSVHPDGRFCLAFASAVTFDLTAKGGGYADSPPLRVALAPGEIRQGVVIRLPTGGTLTGRIVHAGGKPVRFATVSVLDAKTRAYLGIWSGLLPEDGRYRIKGLPTARAKLRVTTVDFLPEVVEDVDLNATGEVVRDVTVRDGGALQVTVFTADDKPVEGAVIRIESVATGRMTQGRTTYRIKDKSLEVTATAELITDAEGKLIYSPLPPGAHKVSCRYRGVKLVSTEMPVMVGRTTYHTFRLPAEQH